MNCGCIKSLHIIERNWRVNKKSKQTCANKIPEAYRNKEIDWPLVCLYPLCRPAECQIMIGFKSHQNQRNYFKRTERGTKCQNSCRSACKIQMMESAYYST